MNETLEKLDKISELINPVFVEIDVDGGLIVD